MSTAVRELLQSFDSMTEIEKREASAAILQRARELTLSDETLTEMADELFQSLDAEEGSRAKP